MDAMERGGGTWAVGGGAWSTRLAASHAMAADILHGSSFGEDGWRLVQPIRHGGQLGQVVVAQVSHAGMPLGCS